MGHDAGDGDAPRLLLTAAPRKPLLMLTAAPTEPRLLLPPKQRKRRLSSPFSGNVPKRAKGNRYERRGSVAIMFLHHRNGDPDTEVMIDPCDIERCRQYTWHLTTDETTGEPYVATRFRDPMSGEDNRIKLSRYILGAPLGLVVVDHINYNHMDNRRRNLRILTPSASARHKKKYERRPFSRSGVRGIRWDDKRRAWQVFGRDDAGRFRVALGVARTIEDGQALQRQHAMGGTAPPTEARIPDGAVPLFSDAMIREEVGVW